MGKKVITDEEIEKTFEAEIFKLNQERNDFLLPQIIDFVETKKWLHIHPEYQRRLVWDKKKKSLFIESLLMNIPIPPIFLYEYDYNRYEVMDGQQRLNTVLEFKNNLFSLTGLEEWYQLNGKVYNDLPPLIKRALDRRRISATVLLVESKAKDKTQNDIRKFVFERLNTGGVKLNAQELRNCVYQGKFNDLIVDLAGNPMLNDALGIPRYSQNIREGRISKNLSENSLFQRMYDCEAVLRFFAFRDKQYVKGAMRKILDECMERYQNITDNEYSDFENSFISSLKNSIEIFGDDAFKLDNKISITLFDAIMVAVNRQSEIIERAIKSKAKIKKDLYEMLSVQKNREIIVGKTGTSSAIVQRSEMIEAVLIKYAKK